MSAGGARSATVVWTMIAAVGWAVTGFLGWQMFSARPRIAAFDLELLVRAGRSIGAGRSPYDPDLVAGRAPDAVDLFYSYPPLVGQAFVPIAGLPLGLIAVAWSILSIALLAVVVVRIGRILAPDTPARTVAAATIAIAVMTLPLLVAVLFGNLDAFFPALYGLVLVAALSARPRDGVIGGIALAIAALTKLYPAAIGPWFLVRALRRRTERGRHVRTIATALGAAVAAVGLSIVAFGVGPWQEYATVAATASRAELVDGRNAAPAAQLALWLGADSGLARSLHLVVVTAAALVIVAAAWLREDTLESLAIAAAASLVVLPVSWIHYPAALLPFVAAAVLRAGRGPDPHQALVRRTRSFAAGALLAAAAAIVWLPSLWLAIALALVAIHASVPAPRQAGEAAPRPAPAAQAPATSAELAP